MADQPTNISPRGSNGNWVAAGANGSNDAALDALRREYEARIERVRAEEKAKYDAQLEGVRVALENMYNQRLEQELQRRLAAAALAGQITDSTNVTDLIEKLFGDRPRDKKQVWIATFEDNEITTVGILRKLSPAGWQRLSLPLGVEQALQDAIKDVGTAKPPATAYPSYTAPASQPYNAPVLTPTTMAPAPAPYSYPAMQSAPPPQTRIFQLPGQNPVTIDDSNGVATTMSGCPYKGCEKDFEFKYTVAGKSYAPKDCPACKRSVKPPGRLSEAAKTMSMHQVVAPAAPTQATYAPPPVAYAPPPVAYAPPPTTAAPAPYTPPPQPAYAAPLPPSYTAPLPPTTTAPMPPVTAPTAPAPQPQLRIVETAGQNAVMVDDVGKTATTMSGCPYKGCEKDFEFKYYGATKTYTPQKCPFCNKTVKAPGRLTKVADSLK